MTESQAKDVIPIRFPVSLGREMRVRVAGSPHYTTLSQFVSQAVREKLEREFLTGGKSESIPAPRTPVVQPQEIEPPPAQSSDAFKKGSGTPKFKKFG